jgi:hypothetical protein
MNYRLLGKLPLETIDFFKEEILKRRSIESYQWVHFDTYLYNKFMEIFDNPELKIAYQERSSRFVIKAVVADPGEGWRIHKDGYGDKGALNVVISVNSADWVRMYNDDFINLYCIMNNIPIKVKHPKSITDISSRNSDIFNYENVSFDKEIRQAVGDVYVIDTNTWHSFKCIGPEPMIVIQAKFDGNPTCEQMYKILSKQSFKNLITNND